jgi:hypothetical protein
MHPEAVFWRIAWPTACRALIYVVSFPFYEIAMFATIGRALAAQRTCVGFGSVPALLLGIDKCLKSGRK